MVTALNGVRKARGFQGLFLLRSVCVQWCFVCLTVIMTQWCCFRAFEHTGVTEEFTFVFTLSLVATNSIIMQNAALKHGQNGRNVGKSCIKSLFWLISLKGFRFLLPWEHCHETTCNYKDITFFMTSLWIVFSCFCYSDFGKVDFSRFALTSCENLY